MSEDRLLRAVTFTAPGQVEVQAEALPPIAAGQVVVRARLSAISAGTELLIFRGLAPAAMEADPILESLPGKLAFPLRYGYACVGDVVEVGPGVDPVWLGRTVFAFQPHQTHFLSAVSDLIPLPSDLALDDAVFLPNLETAVGLVQDARPILGEQVVVLGQGIVGLLTTSLLATMNLGRLVSADRYPARRQASLEAGAHASLDPSDEDAADHLRQALAISDHGREADLVFELSGNPTALDLAIAVAGYDARIVVGSWYGRKTAPVDLGGRFHRNRLRLLSSQVSQLAPSLRGRWTKARRMALALSRLPDLHPARWITHRFPVDRAAEAYQLLDQDPQDALQVVLTYPADG